MTILVPMEQLAQVVAAFGSAQLLTKPGTGWVKVHTVDPVVVEGPTGVAVRVGVEWERPV